MNKNNKPVVHLISKPENMLKTIYTACRTCYSADTPYDIYNSTDDEEKLLKLIERVVSSGHYSTIEHIQVSFAISNVSRACTHQLVRHRHMSFSQKSQRYVQEKGQFEYLIPPTIEKNPELKQKFEDFMAEISKKYLEFTEAGIPAEDARYILPNACETEICVKMNLRELIHFCNERLCTCAQWEIRQLANKMKKCVEEVAPDISAFLVPKCESHEIPYCNETKNRSCGKHKTIKELNDSLKVNQ